MWHEARKQEKMIRGMIVDYRRRAERRKDFYEKIKAEPTQFLQLHGRPCKIHLDPAVAAAGEGPAIMMTWQGDSNNMIDRFDVRAHLDYIPEIKYPDIPPEDLSQEERQCNYERYRILAQNVFLGISEDKFLQQLAIEELFGVTMEEKEMQKEKLNEKKGTGVAIGYNYSDPGAQPSCSNGPDSKKLEEKDSDDDDDELEIIDVDLSIDVNKMEASQAHELNAVGPQFGMAGCDLFSFLTGDADDAEHQKQLLREEKEKAMFSGRKSRRERRAHRDKKLATRVMSPPSYAAPSTRTVRSLSHSPSRSPSPDPVGNIEFITSFGGEDDDAKPPLHSKPLYADKLKQNLKKTALYSEIARKSVKRSKSKERRPRLPIGPRGPNSRSKSFSRSRSRSRFRSHSKSRSRSKSRLRSRNRRRSRSKSRSYSRSHSRSSRSKSRSYSPYRRSRSQSRSRNHVRGRRSRSPNHSGNRKRNSRSVSYESSDRHVQSQPVVPRYYGRRKEDKSSSELSQDSDSSDSAVKDKSSVGIKSNTNQSQYRLSGSSTKRSTRETLSLKEKLKRKMQAQLSRQLRADKRAEAERQERESRRQARRDEEMRELAIKLRRKQREMRHMQSRQSSEDDSDRSQSGSSSSDSQTSKNKKDKKNRSKSPSSPSWGKDNNSNLDAPPPNFQSENLSLNPRKANLEIDHWDRGDSNVPERFQSYPETYRRDQIRDIPNRFQSQNRYDRTNRYGNQMQHIDEDPYENQNRYNRYENANRYDSQNRHDSHNRHDSQSRYDSQSTMLVYERRSDDVNARRAPYPPRGGYRGGYEDPRASDNYYAGGSTDPSRSGYRDSTDRYSKNKVKLVDY